MRLHLPRALSAVMGIIQTPRLRFAQGEHLAGGGGYGGRGRGREMAARDGEWTALAMVLREERETRETRTRRQERKGGKGDEGREGEGKAGRQGGRKV